MGSLLTERVAAHAVAHHEQVTEARDVVARGIFVDLLVRIAAGIGPLSDCE